MLQFGDGDCDRTGERTSIFQLIPMGIKCFFLHLEYILFAYIIKNNLKHLELCIIQYILYKIITIDE